MKKIYLLISILVIFIDQLIKYFIMNNLKLYESISIIPNFFDITFLKNDGGAFSLLPSARWLFIICAIIVAFLLIRYIIKENINKSFELITYSLIIGGVLGNMIDRIFYGNVIDYISFKIFNYNAPVFNFADMCIVIGALMLCIIIIRGDKIENNNSRK